MESKHWIDPVVEEVRAAREAIFKEEGYDLARLHARLAESQKRHGKKLVIHKPLKKTIHTIAK